MCGRKRRIDDVGNSDNDNRKKQARDSNLGSGANSGQPSSASNAEAVAKAAKTTAAVPSQTVSGEALGTQTAPAEAEQSRDKGKQRQEQVGEAKEAAKEAAGGIPVNNKESTAGPSTAPSKQPPVKRHRRKKSEPVPDPAETARAKLKNTPRKRVDRACDNCRMSTQTDTNNKLKCDNNADGCAECAKRNTRCTRTFVSGETHTRGETERLNREVERLRAEVNLVRQENNQLRQENMQVRQENMQLHRVLAGYQRLFPNFNVLWNPRPADQASNAPAVEQDPPFRPPAPVWIPSSPVQAPLYAQHGAYPQAQQAGREAGHFQPPQNPPLTGQGAGSMPLPVNPLGQGAGQPALLQNRPLTGPVPFNFPPALNLPPVTQEPANFPPAAKAPPPAQISASPSSSSSGSSPYRQTPSEASADNDDTNSRAANNDQALANQVAPQMTEQGGGQPAPTARASLDVAMTGLDNDSLGSFSPEPANPDDANRLYVPSDPNGFNGDNGYNGDNGFNGGNGFNGDNGYNGGNGFNGDNGYNGDNGFNGGNGFNSFIGFNGDNGDNGGNSASDMLMSPADRAALLAYTNEPLDPNAAIAAGPATEPLTIDPSQLNSEPGNYPQVGNPATTLAPWEFQNGRNNDGPQQN